MKTTMASAALLLVLALALVTAPLTAEAKKRRPAGGAAGGEAAQAKKIADSFCATFCEGRKGMDFIICKDGCELSQRSNLVLYGRIQCKGKCTETKGITAPQMKACEEQCDKDYVGKAAEVIAACDKCCAREKNPAKAEACKKSCTPPKS